MAIQNASLQPIYERLKGVTGYHPMSAETFADWSIEAGDMVSMYREGDMLVSPVHSAKIVWRGAPQVALNSTGKEERDTIAKISRRKYGRSGAGMRNDQSIHYDLYNEDGRLHSELEFSSSRLRTEFTTELISTIALFHSELEMTSSHLQIEFQQLATSVTAALESELEMTASHLQTEFTNNLNSLHGELEMTASHLQSEFEDGINSVRSEVEQTASSWSAKISGVVDEDGNVTAASIAVAINASTGESEARLDAQKVYIGNQKSTTVIAGKCELSDVTAEYIKTQIASIAEVVMLAGNVTGTLRVRNGSGQQQDVSAGIWDLDIAQNGNTYTLRRKRIMDADWVDVGTFSRATALDGAWSSGTLTVTASPQGNTLVRTIVQDTAGATWGDGYVSVPINSQWTSGASTYTEPTGQSVYIDFSNKFQAKTVSSNGVVYADEGYLGLSSVDVQVQSPAVTPIISYAWSSSGKLTVSTTPAAQENLVRSLYQDTSGMTWSGNTASIPVRARWGSQDQYNEATNFSVSVDATPRYTAGTYAGKASVTLEEPTWNAVSGATLPGNRTVTVSTTGRTNAGGTTENLSESVSLYLTQGNWSGNNLTVSMRTGSTSGTAYAQTTVDASSIWNNGYDTARGYVSAPNTTGTGTTVTIKGPKADRSGQENIRTYTLTNNGDNEVILYTTNGSSNVTVAKLTHNKYTTGVYAGKAAVTLTDPTWNSASTVGTSRTVTVSTTGRTNSSGTTENLSKSVSLYLTQGSWSSGTLVVSMRAGSTSGTVYAQTSVSIPDPTGFDTTNAGTDVTVSGHTNNSDGYYYDSSTGNYGVVTKGTWSQGGKSYTQYSYITGAITRLANARYYSGKAAVTLNDPTWNAISGALPASRTVTVSTSGRTNSSGTTDNLSKSVALYLTQGSWSSGTLVVSMRTGSTSGTAYAQSSVSIPDPSGFNTSSLSGDSVTSGSTTYTNGSDGYQQISTGASGEAVIVIRGSWTQGGKTFNSNSLTTNYLKAAPTKIYQKGYSDGIAAGGYSHSVTLTRYRAGATEQIIPGQLYRRNSNGTYTALGSSTTYWYGCSSNLGSTNVSFTKKVYYN